MPRPQACCPIPDILLINSLSILSKKISDHNLRAHWQYHTKDLGSLISCHQASTRVVPPQNLCSQLVESVLTNHHELFRKVCVSLPLPIRDPYASTCPLPGPPRHSVVKYLRSSKPSQCGGRIGHLKEAKLDTRHQWTSHIVVTTLALLCRLPTDLVPTHPSSPAVLYLAYQGFAWAQYVTSD